MAAAAEKFGLNRKTALIAAAHALADGILFWREAKVPLAQLLQEATTPGGIAAAVMNTMDSSGYQQIIQQGLKAGMARSAKECETDIEQVS